MKSKIIPIISVILVVVVAIGVCLYFFVFANNNIDKLLENEDNQVEVINQAVSDFFSTINVDDSNIIIDSSVFNNFLTKEEFSDESKSKIKEFEKNDENMQNTCKIYVTYLPSSHGLSVKIDKEGIGKEKHEQKYKLSVDGGKIKVERDGLGISLYD